MAEKSDRQFKREVRMRICAILDCSKDRELTQEEQKEMSSLVRLLDSSRRKEEVRDLPFQFDFNHFAAREYLVLRGKGYTVKEIQQMCGVSIMKFYDWRKEKGLLARTRKEEETCGYTKNMK